MVQIQDNAYSEHTVIDPSSTSNNDENCQKFEFLTLTCTGCVHIH